MINILLVPNLTFDSITDHFFFILNVLSGWGTDEKVIISILGHRDSTQRKLIMLAYEELYQENLIDRLKSELSGDFEVCV